MCVAVEKFKNNTMQVPNEMLRMVRCLKCRRYLSSEPVMMLDDGKCVCKSCSNNTNQRNIVYEALAKLMTFPCRYDINGCKRRFRWNDAKDHEENCPYSTTSVIYSSPIYNSEYFNDICSVCKNCISVLPRYQCLNLHNICVQCSQSVYRCLYCKTNVTNNIKYYCEYWKNGCDFIGDYVEAKHHEGDCPRRLFFCPFYESCEWKNTTDNMQLHLKDAHPDKTYDAKNLTRPIRAQDDAWIMVAHDELFKCSVWTIDNSIEWVASYIGAQSNSNNYTYTVELSNKYGLKVKFHNKCLGWNNFPIEKGINVRIDKLTYPHKTIEYSFKINKIQDYQN